MKNKLWAWALHQLQRRCEHPPRHVTADLLEGDRDPLQTRWCRLCGAYQHGSAADYEPGAVRQAWTAPMPQWWV